MSRLVLYGQTVNRMSQSMGLPVKLYFAVLTKHKTPQVQLLPVATDVGHVAMLREGVAQAWHSIQSGNFYPSPSPLNCSTCSFKSTARSQGPGRKANVHRLRADGRRRTAVQRQSA